LEGFELSVVSVVKRRGRDVEATVRDAVEQVGGLGGVINSRSRVLVKPNLVTPIKSGTGVITDCKVTEAVVKLALEQNPAEVVIGEGSGYGYDVVGARADTLQAFKLSGTKEVAERLITEAIKFGQQANLEIIRLQQQLREAYPFPR